MPPDPAESAGVTNSFPTPLMTNVDFVQKYEMRIFKLHRHLKVLHSLNVHFLSSSLGVVIFHQIPAGTRSPDLVWLRSQKRFRTHRRMDDASTGSIHVHLRPFVVSWQQEFVRKTVHKSQLESFLR